VSKKHKWKWPVLITGGVVAVGAFGFWAWLPINGLPTAQKFIRWQFEDVRHITPTGLAEWLADASRTAPVLLDIRREDEFSVSHLPNARRIAPDATDEEIRRLLADPNQPIVVYCAVGYRSGKMARRIQGLGHTNLFNLEGAIFAWATEGNALEGGDKVHPYSAFGRRMLADNLEAN
jgi:rhodanese-related sulfurtransferase